MSVSVLYYPANIASKYAPRRESEKITPPPHIENPLTKVLLNIDTLNSVEFENLIISIRERILNGEKIIEDKQVQNISSISKYVNKNGKHYRIALALLYSPLILTQEEKLVRHVKNAIIELLKSNIPELRYTGLEQIVELLGQSDAADDLLKEAVKILEREDRDYITDYLKSMI